MQQIYFFPKRPALPIVFSIFSKGDHNQIRSIMDSTHSPPQQLRRLLVVLYRRKIQFFRRRMICVVVSNAYCTNLWGTFLCQNTYQVVSLFRTKHLQNKKNLCVCSFTTTTNTDEYTRSSIT